MSRIIIEQRFDNGRVRRCDGKCYHAHSDICTCVCRGVNHQVGEEAALGNAEEVAESIREEYPESTVTTGVV